MGSCNGTWPVEAPSLAPQWLDEFYHYQSVIENPTDAADEFDTCALGNLSDRFMVGRHIVDRESYHPSMPRGTRPLRLARRVLVICADSKRA